jgi:hypothetical protein
MFEQHGENLERLLGKSNAFLSPPPQFPRTKIQNDALEPGERLAACVSFHLPPHGDLRFFDGDEYNGDPTRPQLKSASQTTTLEDLIANPTFQTECTRDMQVT